MAFYSKEDSTDIANEQCWETGIYSGNCDCSLYYHKDECSGSDDKEE